MQRTFSLNQLSDFAKAFWKEIQGETLFAFHGEMGAGKTTIITALCKEKGVRDTIGSPTFSIINEYRYRADGSEHSIFHIDLYRLKDADEIERAGVEDCIYSGEICMVEWPKKAPHLFDDRSVHVYISAIDDNTRCAKVVQPENSME